MTFFWPLWPLDRAFVFKESLLNKNKMNQFFIAKFLVYDFKQFLHIYETQLHRELDWYHASQKGDISLHE